MPAPLSRRRLLAGSAAAGLTALASGCAPLTGRDGPAVPAAPPDPLEPLLRAELALVAQYDEAIGKFVSLAATLRPVREEHAAHAQALRARLDPRRQQAVPESDPPAGSTGASASAARAALAAAERKAVERATAACLAASGDQAALLASITASEAAHLVVLDQ